MKHLRYTLILLGFLLPGCKHEPPPETADTELATADTTTAAERDGTTNSGASEGTLAPEDPRSWRTYPAIVLIATKYQLQIDTTAHLLDSFERRFNRRTRSRLPFRAELPQRPQHFAQYAASMQEDTQYFVEQGRRLGIAPSTVAAVITDFYLLGGSNRPLPENSNGE